MTFRTSQSDALLFFAASPGAQEEYLVIQMRGGRLWFLFDPQGTVRDLLVFVEFVDTMIVAPGVLKYVAFCSSNLQTVD
jgi:hypothetical protein